MRPVRMVDVWADTPPDVIDAGFADGWAAHAEGVPVRACGYPRPTLEALAWVAGHEAGRWAPVARRLERRCRRVALKRSRATAMRSSPSER